MYELIEKNDNYEIGILGDLVCLRFTENFDRVLGEDRGKCGLGTFGSMDVWSAACPDLFDDTIYLPGTDRRDGTLTYRPDNPTEYANKLKAALAAYVESKQPFKDGDVYWTLGFGNGCPMPQFNVWNNDVVDNARLANGTAFKTKEECQAFIEKTEEFWRSLK